MRHTEAMSRPVRSRFISDNRPAPALSRAWRSALDALFPPRCGGCRRFSEAVFCERCRSQTVELRGPNCQICGLLFDPLARGAAVCARCRAQPPAFERARAAWVFEGAPRALIHRFKYERRFALAARLAPPMARTRGAREMLEAWQPQFLVPVPLHASRLRARGFNQSALLARELSLACGVPTLELLQRTRPTPPQVGLARKERQHNVRGAFATDAYLWEKHRVKGARILLIDDVFTTGATLGECAQTLQKAGAAAIGALTIARQGRPDEIIAARQQLWQMTGRF